MTLTIKVDVFSAGKARRAIEALADSTSQRFTHDSPLTWSASGSEPYLVRLEYLLCDALAEQGTDPEDYEIAIC